MSKTTRTKATELMVVNVSPGEECRIAILQDGHLQELYTERTATATNVGNIYKGRVTNVEPAIQAAFVDYGQPRAGFLHISDLHPQYFPGSRRTERVGKKIPRHARPPIQDALKRGSEVLVQVLKEGLGTKGPTLTSYLSIPGRLLVMMPDMDRIGVSRKVEDLDKRRQMRQVLDSLDLPKGFGFILRTAGFGQPKTELKRDVAYLTRLWKVMDQRIKEAGSQCELYAESDLLIRTIRDVLRPSIAAIIVDAGSASDRAEDFLRVVAPRSAPKLIRYRERAPIFHAFDIERQIDLIHSREFPLPSGGKLVIDQAEALVAIDVNSGRSRKATDSETNAFNTNCEAVDEICRQLRLRDLGGLIVNDLIDMYRPAHRREIEERFRNGLKRDRAKTTMLRISDFGIVELTRQRMRPSLQKSHFMECAHCDGRGEVKTPESLTADAMRQVGYLLQFDRVKRVEMVCSAQVASMLLSTKRRELVALEDAWSKKVDVRVSETIAIDRVDYHAYDERNADIDVAKLPTPKPPTRKELEAADRSAETPAPATTKKRRRRGRPTSTETEAAAAPPVDAAGSEPVAAEQPSGAAEQGGKGKKPRRRRRKARAPDDGSIRIHQLAGELGVRSRAILSRCRAEDVLDVANHMASVPGSTADLIRSWFREQAKSDDSAKHTSKEGPEQADSAGVEGKVVPRKTSSRRRRRQVTPPVAADSNQSERSDAAQTEATKKKTRRSSGKKKAATEPAEREGGAVKPSRRRRGRTSAMRSEERSSKEPALATAPPTARNGKDHTQASGRTVAADRPAPVPADTSPSKPSPSPGRPKRGLYRSRKAPSQAAREHAEAVTEE